jgi:methyltransferase (TIGR00027 family)
MNDARPSLTAHRVAVRRAVHQVIDNPKVLDDPLAVPIVHGDVLSHDDDPRTRSLRAFVVLRSRYAEDELARSLSNDVSQYVILGAGLDTFGYRNPHQGLRVFEVDHPATQAWKLAQLNAASIAIPGSVTFVPVDFERQTILNGLAATGFDRRKKTFFSWLGVTPYLTREAFESTLKLVAAMPAGSGVVFDFAVARSSLSALERKALDALAARVASAGEPFRLFFEPRLIEGQLRGMGFRQIERLEPAEMNARYFSNRSDGLRISGGWAHLISAFV